jgi:hypothetical protein
MRRERLDVLGVHEFGKRGGVGFVADVPCL